MPHSEPVPPNAPTLGRYLLERRIASGGMADVYLARQMGAYGFVKRVALKVLKREIAGDDENVKMFIREALVAAEFRHTNLAQVYEVGEIGGRLFIAMELVPGVSVAALLRALGERGKGMPLNVAVRIAIDTLDGLGHAHEAAGPDGKPLGLVHRDVSPQNIMVGVDGTVKVVDFGIARAETSAGRTVAPRIKGKFSYMAPEQWEPRRGLDARADLFALGIVLYEMTTGGERLFRGETPRDIYKAVVLEPIPDPRTRVPEYPEGLARIVMRALERGPNARWPSARAMRTALLEFAQGAGWSLTSKVVADTVRAALGPGDIESRWEPVTSGAEIMGEGGAGGGKAAGVDGAGPAAGAGPDVPRTTTAPTTPGGRRGGIGHGAGASEFTSRTALLLAAAAASGVAGGFVIGRRTGGEARALDPAVHGADAGAPVVLPPRAQVRVRASELFAEALSPMRAAWAQAHPEIDLVAATGSAADAYAALIAGGADVALAARAPDAAELASARARGVELLAEGARPESLVVGHAVAALVVHPSNPVAAIDADQARALYRGAVTDWSALGSDAGAVRMITRPPSTELLALANAALLAGASAPNNVERAESEEAARALVAADGHAVTLLALGSVAAAAGAVRAVRAPGGGHVLAFPVYAAARGAPTGAARSVIDWLRAPDTAQRALHGASVAAPP